MSNPVQFDRAKLRATILHVCSLYPADRLGAVKLHKVLYFTDMLRYAQTGHPLTGSTYVKRPFGPTCRQLSSTLGELERDGLLDVREVDYFGLRKKEYVPLGSAPHDILSDDEVLLIDEVAQFVCEQNTARTISDYSHQAPWERARFGHEIPYSTAYLLFPAPVSEEAFDVAAEGVRQVEAARQNGNALDFADFDVFRRRFRDASSSLRL